MKQIYALKHELDNDPEQVKKAQELTLDNSKPFGLKGNNGLFGSEKWWKFIESKKAKIKNYEGTIERVYGEGMHNEGKGFAMRLNNGAEYKYSCVSNTKADRKFYEVGRTIVVKAIYEELKSGEMMELVLEVSINA